MFSSCSTHMCESGYGSWKSHLPLYTADELPIIWLFKCAQLLWSAGDSNSTAPSPSWMSASASAGTLADCSADSVGRPGPRTRVLMRTGSKRLIVGTENVKKIFWPAAATWALSQKMGASHVRMRYEAQDIVGFGISRAVTELLNWLPHVTPGGKLRCGTTSAVRQRTSTPSKRQSGERVGDGAHR